MSTPSERGRHRREQLVAARLYLICDARPGGRLLQAVLRAAIAGGVDVVQLRDKQLDDEQLTALARQTADLCRELGALFIVNDRPTVALASGADGVHLGQQDTPVAQARQLLGADALIGLSTHAPQEIDALPSPPAGDILGGVDYIGVGPVHATPTKPGRPATGLALVRYAAAHAALPFFAIGGIHAGNAAAVVDAGARRLAVVRAIAQAADPEQAARELRAQLADPSAPACDSARRA
ncbi:MAG TPA: thiamine phosphate synthase [Solirubrobacteraceae bacterium]|nr:thiamine phosphate synthase [Solirubrobacteraceae bacterium]